MKVDPIILLIGRGYPYGCLLGPLPEEVKGERGIQRRKVDSRKVEAVYKANNTRRKNNPLGENIDIIV